MSVEKLVEHFSALEDPRCAGKVDHRLIDILVIAVCGGVCGDRVRRELGRHRALRPQQAGLAEVFSDAG
jgi:hypothetical protein